ncbi:BirA family transcriptional regulator, biotin operon repressor / biotin-[acetyl-CoA-carboxylase] ligase [Marivirga sericea]|uniref:BirA family transcriptional regulator, biotin operon repressor / biotin-[acetyl-CoA-carboxylase] ligase n=1 Tax=Marivirga sericea TaxID=1028 RepID=A0A1X7L9N0_9BACT|nr:biotin--[acetyl-CoA-carboxylase] ligase [Marivirga sericea]SMG50548.1 BirA family transcriptional regulator, biotin operon repressor / biotin-[acetyl-CoA-carboxylase] ligase [Marivirga sericea]
MGKQLVSLPSCHSTNDVMAQMSAKNQLHEGAIIITKHQTKGKGQRGNEWNSPAGQNLTFSIFLRPRFLKATQQFELNRMVSLSLLDVVKNFKDESRVFVKWPNDLILNKKKVAGILIENSISQNAISESIVGIGLNVNQTENLLPTATSLQQQFNKEFELEKILLDIVQRLEHYYLIMRSQDFRFIHELYESKLYLKDKVAYYEDGIGKFNGIIRKVYPDGVLEIEDEGGIYKKYQFKEVRLLS